MNNHDKISFAREYCRCRRIPYRIIRESLYIAGRYVCYSLYNIPYREIVEMIDNSCEYDENGYFVRYLIQIHAL